MNGLGLVILGSPLHDEEQIVALKQELVDQLTATDLMVEELERPRAKEGDRLQAILVLTGGVEQEALQAAELFPPHQPVILLAHPGHNSLPAAMEVHARLRATGRRAMVLYGQPEELAERLMQQAQLAEVWDKFTRARFGLIGKPSDWLVASDVSRERLRELGLELIELGTDELIARVRAQKPKNLSPEIKRMRAQARAIAEPDEEALIGALRIYHALSALVQELKLDAFTIRCFDLIAELGNTGCYALARLNAEGITAGCEGDLQAMFSMHLARVLTGGAAFMGNVARIDSSKKGLLLAHCTCSLSLAQGYGFRSHFESGLGVGIAAELPPGPMTLFRLGGEDLDQLFVVAGEIRPHRPEEGLCLTQVLLKLQDDPDQLLQRPLGNHHVLVPGHHRAELEALFQHYLAGLP